MLQFLWHGGGRILLQVMPWRLWPFFFALGKGMDQRRDAFTKVFRCFLHVILSQACRRQYRNRIQRGRVRMKRAACLGAPSGKVPLTCPKVDLCFVSLSPSIKCSGKGHATQLPLNGMEAGRCWLMGYLQAASEHHLWTLEA